MRKVLLSAVAAMFALAAGAQNKAIDDLVEKYTDAEGFTVVNMEGEALRSLSSMMANGNGTVNIGERVPDYEIGELMKKIVSVTAIVLQRADEAFTDEVQAAIGSGKYSPIVSHNSDDEFSKLVSMDIKRGKLKGNKEIVLMFVNENMTVLARVIGNIDSQLLAKLAAQMHNKS